MVGREQGDEADCQWAKSPGKDLAIPWGRGRWGRKCHHCKGLSSGDLRGLSRLLGESGFLGQATSRGHCRKPGSQEWGWGWLVTVDMVGGIRTSKREKTQDRAKAGC